MTNFLNCADNMCIPCADCHPLYGESFIHRYDIHFELWKGCIGSTASFLFLLLGEERKKAFWMRTEVYYYISVDWSSRTH